MKPIYLQSTLSLVVIPVQTGIKDKTLSICRRAQMQGGGLWIPRPVQEDKELYPECYAGISILLTWKEVVPFVGKEDYPMLLKLLQSMQEPKNV